MEELAFASEEPEVVKTGRKTAKGKVSRYITRVTDTLVREGESYKFRLIKDKEVNTVEAKLRDQYDTFCQIHLKYVVVTAIVEGSDAMRDEENYQRTLSISYQAALRELTR